MGKLGQKFRELLSFLLDSTHDFQNSGGHAYMNQWVHSPFSCISTFSKVQKIAMLEGSNEDSRTGVEQIRKIPAELKSE